MEKPTLLLTKLNANELKMLPKILIVQKFRRISLLLNSRSPISLDTLVRGSGGLPPQLGHLEPSSKYLVRLGLVGLVSV